MNLRRHGENVKPTYMDTEGNLNFGQSTNADRRDGQTSGIVKRFGKKMKASEKPTALGLIKTCYPDAIEMTGISHEVRGLVIFLGILSAAVGIGLGQMFFFGTIADGLERTIDKIFLSISVLFIFCGLYLLLKSIRHEFFRPDDEPTIFDRKRRKVYRIFREVSPGWKGLFQRWSMRAAEYEWDLIDVEHNAVLMTTGSTITRLHNLVFIVRKSAKDPTIIDSFGVGNSIQLGESTVAQLWEHIRRFMEESGPHIPDGEFPITSDAPTTLWESMATVGPFSSKYFKSWRTERGFMILYHLLLPLFLPMFVLWGIFNWLSYKTATPIEWPREILDEVN